VSRWFRIGWTASRLAPFAAALVLAMAVAGCGQGDAGRLADEPSPSVAESLGEADGRGGPVSPADISAGAPETADAESGSGDREAGTAGSGTAKQDGTGDPAGGSPQDAGTQQAPEPEREAPPVPAAEPGKQGAAKPAPAQDGKQAAAGKETAAPPPSPKPTVTVSIVGTEEYGEILPPTETELQEGDTVADVLFRLAKANRISVDTRGSGAMLYVEGIAGLYELDEGPTSGWIYLVNGVEHRKSAGTYRLEAGDRVEWRYVTDISETTGE
jgi:hypothetical protein